MEKAQGARAENDKGAMKDSASLLATNFMQEYYDKVYVQNDSAFRTNYANAGAYAKAQFPSATAGGYTYAVSGDTLTVTDSKGNSVVATIGDNGNISWSEISANDELGVANETYTVTIITGSGIETATASKNVKKGESLNLTATKANGATGDIFWKVTSGNSKDIANTTNASTTVTPTANITIEASVITHNVYAATFEVGTEKVLVLNNNEWQSSDTYQGTTPSNIIGEYGDFSGYNSNTDNITKVDILNDIYPNSTENYFDSAYSLKIINNINKLHTDFVTSMDSMFLGCTSLTNIDVSNFNTRNVTNMQYMFCGISMNDLDITNFDTSNVTNMNQMFSGPADGCQIKTIYIGENWSVEKVVDDYSMFGYDGGILEGEKGTKASDYIDGNDGGCNDTTKTPKDYAHIDGGSTNPGFFTQGPAPISN